MTNNINSAPRLAYALAIIAFGIQHLVYGQFVTRVVPPMASPSHWAYLAGAVLICAGLAMTIARSARAAGLLLGLLILAGFVAFYVPLLLRTQLLSGVWTNAGKALVLAGGALLVAGLPTIFARLFLSAFFIVAGIQHFIFVQFVAGLVPAWIPFHIFWTYFAGIALIAGGIGMLIPRLVRLAAALSGVMVLLWLILLHIPRALAAPNNANETTAVFEALAVSAVAFMIAAASGMKRRYR